MSQSFADIAYTASVRKVQQRNGSHESRHYPGVSGESYEGLSVREAGFISERDSFYLSTVSESGWPYVQHRGGPAGFLRVLDSHTLAYADFSGNRQYVSVGNLEVNNRVALIMTDYANRQRLKIFGRIRMIENHDNPDLLVQLAMPGYRAKVERAMIIDVQASDWNCPQHIVRRFSEDQVQAMLAPLLEENRLLKAAH